MILRAGQLKHAQGVQYMSLNSGCSNSRTVSFLTHGSGVCSLESGLPKCSAINFRHWAHWLNILGSLLRALQKHVYGSWFSAPHLFHLGTPVQPNLPLLPGPVGCWAESANCMWKEKPWGLKIPWPLQLALLRKSWHHPNVESPFWDLCRRRALCAWIIASPPFLQNLAHGE